MSKNGSKVKIDIAVLNEKVEDIEKNVQSLHDKVDKILENHLPHLHNRIGELEKRIAYYSGGVAVVIFLSELVFKFLK